MRLCFITNGSEEDLKFASSEGIPCVEIAIHDNLEWWEGRYKEYLKMCHRYNVEIAAIGLWGRNYLSDEAEEREKCLAELARTIELASELGTKVVITGGGINHKETIRQMAMRACDLLAPFVERADEYGLKFAFYNCRWANHIIGSEAWDVVLERLPTAGIKYDPSHPFYEGIDYLRELRDYGGRIFHLHAKGCLKIDGKRFDDPPAGMDQIDWGSIFAILYKHGYDGAISIEPHSETWLGERYYFGIRFAKRFLEQFIAQ
ncbi:MAG: sugar phosphate isomerase/epimerase [Armatimonadota bacterium]|nr:sugar phosphate isomerase/epimerase [Armatimonadota bacterium]MCX7778224.1 sugar phosphate isomerase/epimerase [Armatimonadota bacterium]MDW8024490.1 sugar phosphate isomerase/epimerase [Armatimonadota bacterium]